MADQEHIPKTLDDIKRQARQLSKSNPTLSYMQALEQIAKQLGFNTYAALRVRWRQP